MQSTKNNAIANKIKGGNPNYRYQCTRWYEQEITVNETRKNYTINNKWHVPQMHSQNNPYYNPRYHPHYNPRYHPHYNPRYHPHYNPRYNPRYNPHYNPRYNSHYADSAPTNYVAQTQYEVYNQYTSEAVCEKWQDSKDPSINSEKFSYNSHYADSSPTNYVAPTQYEVYNQYTSEAVCEKWQDSKDPAINSEKFSYNNSKQRYHPYQNPKTFWPELNSVHPPVFITNTTRKPPAGGGKIKTIDHNRELLNTITQEINMNTPEGAKSPTSSLNSSAYSSCPSPSSSTSNDFSLPKLTELPSEMEKPNIIDVVDNRISNSKKSDLVYDMESNSLILTTPYEVVDAPIALAPMNWE